MRLRNLFLALIFILLTTITTQAAFLCDGSNDYFRLNGNTLEVLPDGDWTFYIKVKVTSNAGTSENKILSSSLSGATFEIDIEEASKATNPNELIVELIDDDGTDNSITTTTAPMASNTNWTIIIIQRVTNTVSVYVNGSLAGSATNANFDAVSNFTNITFCNRASLSAGKEFPGAIAEVAFWPRALTAGELVGLNADFAPNCFPGTWNYYVPAIRDYNETKAGITVTNGASTAATTVTTHSRMIYCN